MLALHGDEVDQEQHYDHRQDGSEIQVEFFANRHALLLISLPGLRPCTRLNLI
jgi:hypothetical protein